MSPDTVTIGGRKYRLEEVEEDAEQAQEAVKEAKKAAKGKPEEEAKEAAEEAAEEKGMSASDAKVIAQAVVSELKEGGYLEESGEASNSEADKEGSKETEEKGSTGGTESADDEKPGTTHRWYK